MAGAFVEIECPIDPQCLTPLPSTCKRVQLTPSYVESDVRPNERDFQILSDYLAEYPNVTLRIYGSTTVNSLEFLRLFPKLRRLEIDVFELSDFSGVRFLSDGMHELALGATRAQVDVSFVNRFRELSYLHLVGHTKGISGIGALTNLKRLSLRSITLPDLSVLLPLRNLLDLEIRLGGTKDLGLLPMIGRLRYIHLWLVRGLNNLLPIGEVRTLQNLFLQALKNVKALPSFAQNEHLRRVVLYQMKGIADLEQLASAPALQELAVLSMPQLSAASFECLRRAPL